MLVGRRERSVEEVGADMSRHTLGRRGKDTVAVAAVRQHDAPLEARAAVVRVDERGDGVELAVDVQDRGLGRGAEVAEVALLGRHGPARGRPDAEVRDVAEPGADGGLVAHLREVLVAGVRDEGRVAGADADHGVHGVAVHGSRSGVLGWAGGAVEQAREGGGERGPRGGEVQRLHEDALYGGVEGIRRCVGGGVLGEGREHQVEGVEEVFCRFGLQKCIQSTGVFGVEARLEEAIQGLIDVFHELAVVACRIVVWIHVGVQNHALDAVGEHGRRVGPERGAVRPAVVAQQAVFAEGVDDGHHVSGGEHRADELARLGR